MNEGVERESEHKTYNERKYSQRTRSEEKQRQKRKEEGTTRRKGRRKGTRRKTKLKINKEEHKSDHGSWSCLCKEEWPLQILSNSIWRCGNMFTTMLSTGVATFISTLCLILISGLYVVTSLSVCTSWFHNTVTSSCLHTGWGMCVCVPFYVILMPNALHVE